MKHYEILQSFTYERHTPEGVVAGEFHPGVTGDDLSDAQIAVLEDFAVPGGLARYADASASKSTPSPAPKAPAAPEQEQSA